MRVCSRPCEGEQHGLLSGEQHSQLSVEQLLGEQHGPLSVEQLSGEQHGPLLVEQLSGEQPGPLSVYAAVLLNPTAYVCVCVWGRSPNRQRRKATFDDALCPLSTM